MTSSIFVSDIHLDIRNNKRTDLFLSFLDKIASKASSLYILGDLFDAWIGDDTLHNYPRIIDAFAKLNLTTNVYIIKGNRDFLLGDDFVRATKCTILPDTFSSSIHGNNTLLLHGDTLCTDDEQYQQFRTLVHNPKWQQDFLSKSFEERVEFVNKARAASMENYKSSNQAAEVTFATLFATAEQHNANTVIHGHIHREGFHHHESDSSSFDRFVLKDWNDTTGSVVIEDNGFKQARYSIENGLEIFEDKVLLNNE